MRRIFQVALIACLLLAGCKEQPPAGPTEAERAQLYLAAKAALEKVEKEEAEFKAMIDNLRNQVGEVPDDIMKNYTEFSKASAELKKAAQSKMDANSPLSNP